MTKMWSLVIAPNQPIPISDKILNDSDHGEEGTSITKNVVEFCDLDLDPKYDNVSEHSSDNEKCTYGYEDDESCSPVQDNINVDVGTIEGSGDLIEWCHCGECHAVHSPGDDYCCNQSECISKIRGEVPCITQAKIYKDIVENRDMLKMLRYTYKMGKNYKVAKDIDPDNRAYRHLSYKFFVFMINCHSTVHMTRYILPSCVIRHIRILYPDENTKYTGFRADNSSVLTYKDF